MSLKRAVWAILLIVLVLPSCARAPSPQETSVPATTEVPTATPTQIPPSDTPVPTQVPPTETPTPKEYPTCTAETWKLCYIPPEDLGIKGKYWEWSDSLPSPDLPNPDKTKVTIRRYGPGNIVYEGINGNDIKVGDVPFSIGPSFGYTKCNVSWGVGPDEMTCAVVQIRIAIPDKPGKVATVLGLNVQGYNYSDAQMAHDLKHIQNKRLLMLGGFKIIEGTNIVQVEDARIDILEETLANYPDIYKRIEDFRETGDPSTISGPGIVFTVFAVQ